MIDVNRYFIATFATGPPRNAWRLPLRRNFALFAVFCRPNRPRVTSQRWRNRASGDGATSSNLSSHVERCGRMRFLGPLARIVGPLNICRRVPWAQPRQRRFGRLSIRSTLVPAHERTQCHRDDERSVVKRPGLRCAVAQAGGGRGVRNLRRRRPATFQVSSLPAREIDYLPSCDSG